MIKLHPSSRGRQILRRSALMIVFACICLVFLAYKRRATGTKPGKNVSGIACIVASDVKRLKLLRASYQVWGNQCEKFILLGNELKKSFTVDEPNNIIFLGNFEHDDYHHLVHKIYKGFEFAYSLPESCGWILKADDDTFIHMDNLRKFLRNKTMSSPTAFGFYFKTHFSGGAGYVVNRAGLLKLNLRKNCEPPDDRYHFEDVFMFKCLHRSGVQMGETTIEGKQLFNPLNLDSYIYNQLPDWMFSMSAIPPRLGNNCCTSEAISFHYVDAREMYRMKERIDTKSWERAVIR